MSVIKKILILSIGLAILLVLLGIFTGDILFLQKTNLYGNFDINGFESWVMKLWPGISDDASSVVYGKYHIAPLKAIGILFTLTLILTIIVNAKSLLTRGFVQWGTFVTARLGVLRVSGVCPVKRNELLVFPFANCMACEMATGACPIGTLQWGLINGKIIYLAIGTVMLFGALFGRAVCGWLCPFGFILDLFGKLSLRLIKLPKQLGYVKFFMLALLFITPLFGFPVYCVFFCQSANIYGLLPYYFTTGFSSLKEAISTNGWFLSILGFHFISIILLFTGILLIGGRWFCKVLCPLGAVFGIFNYLSPLKVSHDNSKCKNCSMCSKKCPMDISIQKSGFIDTIDCIKCGKCTKLCKARSFKLELVPKK